MEPSVILDALKVLVSPADPKEVSKAAADRKDRLDFMLQMNCEKVRCMLRSDSKFAKLCHLTEASDTGDIRQRFVELNIHLLRALCQCLASLAADPQNSLDTKQEAPPLPADAISVSSQQIFMTSVQFIMGLGIHPALLPGVGPKSQTGCVLGHASLAECVRVLFECTALTSVGDDIVRCHLGDLIVALCQLAYGPEAGSDAEMQRWSVCRLDAELKQRKQSLIMKELLLLQGPPEKQCAVKGLTPAPSWLRDACSRMLADRLMPPDGLGHLLAAMLSCPQSGEFDWKRCDALAAVIVGCARRDTSDSRVYCKAICPQMLELLRLDDSPITRQYVRVAVSTIAMMERRHPQVVSTHVLQPLFSPLQQCLQSPSYGSECKHSVVVSEDDLCRCIEDIHKVFVAGAGPGDSLLNHLEPFSHVLFQLLCATKRGISHLGSLIEPILVKFLKAQQTSHVWHHLRGMAFDVADVSDGLVRIMDPGIAFSPATGGGIALVIRTNYDGTSQLQLESCELKATLIAEILRKMQRDSVTAEFVLYLLKALTSIISDETTAETCDVRLRSRPLDGAEGAAALNHNLQVLTLLAQMCEVHGHKCFRSNDHVLQFVKVTLERGVQVLQNTDDENFGLFESETLTMAMGLLTAILSQTAKLTTSDRERSKDLLPLLQHLTDSHPNEELREMAMDLRIAIATHNAIPSQFARDFARNFQKKCSSVGAKEEKKADGSLRHESQQLGKTKPLIEVLSSENFDNDTSARSRVTEIHDTKIMGTSADSSHIHTTDNSIEQDNISAEKAVPTPQNPNSSALSQAFAELLDPLIPVRGHALLSLRHLVETGDTATLASSNTLLEVFRENLAHPDSYLHLAAIGGLAALGEKWPGRVLPILVAEMAISQRDSGQRQSSRSAEHLLKLAEVMLRVCRSLGETIPQYRDELLGVFMAGIRDNDPLIRASNLSNLAEVCSLLNFSLGAVIHEIFQCVSSSLKSDSDADVRKAAASFINLLIRGTAKNTLQVLEPVLKDMYRLLKRAVETDSEEMVRVHAQLALEELDSIMREFLFPPQTLSKKITVLHP